MQGLKRAKQPAKKTAFEGKPCLVVMRNITTSTDLPKGESPELLEARRTEAVLRVPAGTCAEGHLLLLRFFDEQEYLKVRNSPRSVQDKAQLLAVTGRVVSVEAPPSQKSRVTLELNPSADKEWQALVKSFRAPEPVSEASAKKTKKA
jgi:hypothetical protein